QVTDLGAGEGGRKGEFRGVLFLGHQAEVNPLGLGLVVLPLAERDLPAVAADVPGVGLRAVPRARRLHEKPPVRKKLRGLKGCRVRSRGAATPRESLPASSLQDTVHFTVHGTGRGASAKKERLVGSFYPDEPFVMSGRLDSNQRPPEPHAERPATQG